MKKLLLLALVACTLPAFAQKELTLSDAIRKAGSDFAPKHLEQLQWVPNTDTYCYVKDDVLLRGTTGKNLDAPIVDLKQLNTGMNGATPMKRFPGIEWTGANLFEFTVDSTTYQYDVSKAALLKHIVLPGDAERQDHDDLYQQVAYTRGNDLYIHTTREREHTIRVTTDGADGLVNGRSVHREEYGITKGTFWSPKGNLLAFYRMDESMVTPYFLEDISTKPSTFNKIRYPMAGQASHHVTLGVFDVKSHRTVFMQTGEPADQYLTNIAWDPSEQFVYIVQLNRATDHLKVVQYEVATGRAVRTLFEEEDKVWLEPLHAMQFLKKTPTNFIWWSQRDGYMHLYLYDLKAGLIRQLTKGPWVVKRIVGFDEKEGYMTVEGTGDPGSGAGAGATETYLYRVNMAQGGAVRMPLEPGTHSGELCASGKCIIDRWSSLTVPGRTVLRDAKGTATKTLLDAPDPLAGYTVGTIELLDIKGEFGDVLHARLIKPHGFDAKKKYPVLVYLYNGPHVQLVTNSFLGGASLWMLQAAERGYLVFTVDGHGSDFRGKAFEQVIHRQLGTVEVKDQLHGVDYLKSLPYVDDDRMAVHGWSFGGFMTTSLMLKAPGTFKVGVAGGPVMDWSMYEVMYTERYMDTPQENPEGYANAALPDKAANLKGDLLIIHGQIDDTVLPEHSLTFLKNCVDRGVQVDFFEYPGHPHNVRGKDRVHLMTKVLDHIDKALGVVH